MPFEQRSEIFMRNDADGCFGQHLGTIERNTITVEPKECPREREMQDLAATIFEEVVQKRPPLSEQVDRFASFPKAEEVLASLKMALG